MMRSASRNVSGDTLPAVGVNRIIRNIISLVSGKEFLTALCFQACPSIGLSKGGDIPRRKTISYYFSYYFCCTFTATLLYYFSSYFYCTFVLHLDRDVIEWLWRTSLSMGLLSRLHVHVVGTAAWKSAVGMLSGMTALSRSRASRATSLSARSWKSVYSSCVSAAQPDILGHERVADVVQRDRTPLVVERPVLVIGNRKHRLRLLVFLLAVFSSFSLLPCIHRTAQKVTLRPDSCQGEKERFRHAPRHFHPSTRLDNLQLRQSSETNRRFS